MAQIFIIIYNFFKRHKIWFIVFLTFIIVSAVSFIANIKLEEDINNAIPGKDKKDKINIAFQNTGIADKLIINISLTDSLKTANPDSLTAFAEELGAELKSERFKPFLKGVFYKINDSLFSSVSDIFYLNYPVFLNNSDLNKLDSILTPNNIEKSLQKTYESLISPASFAFKENITLDPLGITGMALKKLNSASFDENYNIYNGYILTTNKKNLFLFANTVNAANKTAENTQMAAMLEETIKAISLKHNNTIKAEPFGSALISVANANTLKTDIILTFSIATILLILIISFSVRDKRVFLIIFIPTVLAGGLALSFLTYMLPALSVITLSMAPIILAITVDYSLHIISHQKHKKDIIATLKDVAFPIMVCGIATAFEFISLFFVSSKVLQELGVFAAISVIVSAALSLIILPQIIDKNKRQHIIEKNYLENLLDKITHFEFDKFKPILITFSILTIVFIYFAFQVEFEGDLMKMNYMSDDLRIAENNLKKINDFTDNTAYVISYGKTTEEALKNNEIAQIRINELKSNNTITKFRSVTDILISDSTQNARINNWKTYWTKEKKDSVKIYINKFAINAGFSASAFDKFLNSIDKEYKLLSQSSFNLLKRSTFFLDEF